MIIITKFRGIKARRTQTQSYPRQMDMWVGPNVLWELQRCAAKMNEGGPGRMKLLSGPFLMPAQASGSCELLLLMPSFLAPSIVVAQQQQRQF